MTISELQMKPMLQHFHFLTLIWPCKLKGFPPCQGKCVINERGAKKRRNAGGSTIKPEYMAEKASLAGKVLRIPCYIQKNNHCVHARKDTLGIFGIFSSFNTVSPASRRRLLSACLACIVCGSCREATKCNAKQNCESEDRMIFLRCKRIWKIS